MIKPLKITYPPEYEEADDYLYADYCDDIFDQIIDEIDKFINKRKCKDYILTYTGLTWRRQNGFIKFSAEEITDMPNHIWNLLFLQNADCSLDFEFDRGAIYVMRYSHDEPVGCSMVVMPRDNYYYHTKKKPKRKQNETRKSD